MAELTPSPSLPSTADATPYVPVSWMAVAALAVAITFAVTLLALGVFAFTNKKPLLEDWLLAMPAVAIVLSFAARRVIRNSEGTRTGEKLAVTAWWMALILGLCYIAYLFAIDYAIRRDARGEVEKWFGFVNKGGAEDVRRAFHRTLPPGQRNISPDDPGMELRYRDEMLVFRDSDLLRIAQRNKDKMTFTPGTVTWLYRPGVIECVVTGTAKCPEGSFPIVVPLKGVEGVTGSEGGGGGRQWLIDKPRGSGFIDQTRAKRTDYGWLLAVLEESGSRYGKEFVGHVLTGPASHPYAYRAFVVEGGDLQGWGEVARDPKLQFFFAIPTRAQGDAGYSDYMANHFYRLPGGTEPTADQKARFFNSWNSLGIRPAGDKLKAPDGSVIDKENHIAVTEAAVEVRVPIEIPLLGVSGKYETARGRVVVECKDPAVLAELKQLKDSANPDRGTEIPSDELIRRRFTWRVVRIESNMEGINIAPQGPPGPPGGPAMPGG